MDEFYLDGGNGNGNNKNKWIPIICISLAIIVVLIVIILLFGNKNIAEEQGEYLKGNYAIVNKDGSRYKANTKSIEAYECIVEAEDTITYLKSEIAANENIDKMLETKEIYMEISMFNDKELESIENVIEIYKDGTYKRYYSIVDKTTYTNLKKIELGTVDLSLISSQINNMNLNNAYDITEDREITHGSIDDAVTVYIGEKALYIPYNINEYMQIMTNIEKLKFNAIQKYELEG